MEERRILMKIIKGKIPCAKKIVVYGPEGIGKSTFASQFPDPVFIDTEGSTKDMNVARFEKPSSWTMIYEQINYIITNPTICKTLVVDTIDWAEQLCIEHICAKHNKSGIEDFGYGNGYVYAKEEFGRFLNRLEEVIQKGINVVLTAHAQMRKFEQPDEMGAYDRWELKLGKKTTSQTSPLVKEWADMVLFANYKTFSVAIDDKGKKRKAQGGKRVMYTMHHPCWDAKNRYGLPEELDFEYSQIATIIEQIKQCDMIITKKEREVTAPVKEVVTKETQQTIENSRYYFDPESHSCMEIKNGDAILNANLCEITKKEFEMYLECEKEKAEKTKKESNIEDLPWVSNPENIPKALKDLMRENRVSEWDIQTVVAARGYYPDDVPIEKYDPDFIMGVLVGAWAKVFKMIQESKENQEVPFN